ncbi:fimbria/pilus periplasmic chaperone (plasmid) [Klebsiella pneumoniae]|uniref:fimbria/pilus periplasmic chaperone n=1 Tax=Klebsiella pneumoniae TaxID=573 RepID=UPI0039823347
MTSEQLKNMRGLLNNRILHGLIISILSLPLEASNLGVAIEPMEIKAKPNAMVDVRIYNDTEEEYIITQKVISKEGVHNSNKTPFFVNPPVRLLKKKSNATTGVIYIPDKNLKKEGKQYYLSVRFIPKTRPKSDNLLIPVVLIQQIPIVIENE